MTASRDRRRRTTLLALAFAVVSLAAVAVLGLVGFDTIKNSTAGRQAEVDENLLPTARLPKTATALLGIVDESGRLTSSVVMVLEPDGTGGTIVVLAASADSGFGVTGALAPLDATLAVAGPTAYGEAVERLTSLSFDVLEIADAERLAGLVGPLGEITVNLPVGARDTASGVSWEPGELVATAPEIALLMTANDPTIGDWYYEPTRAAVWDGIADRVGAGIGSAEPVATDLDLPAVVTLDEFVDRLFADRVEARSLDFTVLPDQQVAEQAQPLVTALGGAPIDVVVHDRAEMLMTLGAIAPARLGAPLEAPRVRLVSGFSDADLDEVGLTDDELLTRALGRLLEGQVNVVSVAAVSGDPVPDMTLVRVADRNILAGVDDAYRDMFGLGDAVLAGVAIEGVDLEIVLGRTALESLAAE